MRDARQYSSRPFPRNRPRGLFDNIIDSRRELGSLFSPYWQARLVDTPCDERQRIAISYGSVAPCMPDRG